MSQQTKQLLLSVNGNNASSKPQKSSRVQFADIQTAIEQTNNIKKRKLAKQKVHVNILLEGDTDTYNIIGYVIINEKNDELLTLYHIRNAIKTQFDDDQLNVLGGGDTFKFLNDFSLPISKKQEQLINVTEITISNQKDIRSLLQNTSTMSPRRYSSKLSMAMIETPISFTDNTGFDIIDGAEDMDDIGDIDGAEDMDDPLTDPSKPRLSRASSEPHSRDNSLEIDKILPTITSTIPAITAPIYKKPSYETLPHHYQYLGGSTMPPPSHLVPSTPDTRMRYDKKQQKILKRSMTKRRATAKIVQHQQQTQQQQLPQRHSMPPSNKLNILLEQNASNTDLSMFGLSPRAVTHIVAQSDTNNNNLYHGKEEEQQRSDIIYYSVIVRAPMIQNLGTMRYNSFRSSLTPVCPPQDDNNNNNNDVFNVRQGSLSIFGKFQDETAGTLDYNNTIRSSKKSRIWHKNIDSMLDTAPEHTSIAEMMDDDMDELAVNPKIRIELNDMEMDKDSNLAPSMQQQHSDASIASIDTPRSPNDQTRLEVQFGGKLPKIRADKSTTRMMPTDQITSILANAMIDEEPITKKKKHSATNTALSAITGIGGMPPEPTPLTADKSNLFKKTGDHDTTKTLDIVDDEEDVDPVFLRENTTQTRWFSKSNNLKSVDTTNNNDIHQSRTSLIKLGSNNNSKSPPALKKIQSNEEVIDHTMSIPQTQIAHTITTTEMIQNKHSDDDIFANEALYTQINETKASMRSSARDKRLKDYDNNGDGTIHHRNMSDERLLQSNGSMILRDENGEQRSSNFFEHIDEKEIAKSKSAYAEDDVLIEKSPQYVPCRFTVIGSPLLTKQEKTSNPDIKIDQTTQRTWMFYDPSELILGLQGVHHSEENPVWMDLVCDAETFVMISEHVRPSIHGLTIEDCVTPECREKLEMFDDYLFCCIRTTSVHQEHFTEKLCIIVFRTMILTYHTGEACDIVITECRNRLEKRHQVKCPSPGWVAHTIIDVIVDRMIPEVECRVQEVQNVENLVFALSGTSQDELLQRLQIARNWLMVYRSRLWPKSTMTHNFVNTDWRTFLAGVQQQYWNDINDHVARMVDLLSLGQSTLESCQNIFVAKISLEMADQSNQLSDSAGRLTAVGSIFLPLSFFAGLWGMNCKVPFQYEGPDVDDLFGDDYWGFMIVFCLMILSAVVTYKFAMRFT